MPKQTLADLNKMLMMSETADKFLFSEQRSNILLVAGEHYTKRNSRYWNRLRETRYLTQDQKLRLTKNHIQKIIKTYVNNIVSLAPGVAIVPNNEDELQDKKSAELNNSVWQFAKKRYRLKEKVRELAEDYMTLGESILKITWDERKGDHVGYSQKVDPNTGEPLFGPPQPVVDPATGQPMIDPNTGMPAMQKGEPVPDEENPIFTGDFSFKRIFGFNLRRPNGIQRMDDAKWLCEVEMEHVDKVKSWVKDDPEKLAKITEDTYEQFYVFDGNLHGYDYKKDYTQVFSLYYRPCFEYPNGYYYIFTKGVILFEGELPFGIFPIVYTGFDPVQTAPRHRSIIKQLRPYQIEINRCASKIAEHQVTLGDDKILTQSGTKITAGINLPGVRAMQYTGKEPVIIGGRSGAQYLEYMDSQISEMYHVANMTEEMQEKQALSSKDPFGQLFKSMREQKKFSLYASKFEQFHIDICELFLKLSKNYYDQNFLIPMIGKNEFVNISEFQNAEELSFQIKLEPRSDDMNTQFGKQLVINHALQFIGGNLDKTDVGKLMRAMPMGNFEEAFGDMTLDHDLADNLCLALDRGEQPQPSPYDDTTFVIKKLVHRIRQPDFRLLPPQVQQNYQMYKQYYEMMEVKRQQDLIAANADFIPTGGAKVKVDLYLENKKNPEGKPERATLPIESLDWLVKRLEAQGSSQERLNQLNSGVRQEIGNLRLNAPKKGEE